MKDIREVLFEQYSDEVENAPATKIDSAMLKVLFELESIDAQLFDKVLGAVTDAINEQMKMAYMAGFSSGANTCHIATAYAVVVDLPPPTPQRRETAYTGQ